MRGMRSLGMGPKLCNQYQALNLPRWGSKYCNTRISHPSSIQSLSCVWIFETPWTAAHKASLSINSWSLLKLMSIELVMPSNHLILCYPPAFNLLQHRDLSNESGLHIRWPSIGASASVSFHPMNIQGWFPLEIDCFELLAVQGTLKSLFQRHSSKEASICWC